MPASLLERGLKMACSFAVGNIVLSFCLLYSTLNLHCRADKEFLFEKGDLYQRRLRLESKGESGIGWIKEGTAAKSCSGMQENWFLMRYIDIGNATNVYMDIEYKSRKTCNVSGCGLFVRVHKGSVGSNSKINMEQFTEESFSLAPSKNRKITNVHFDITENKRYVAFAVQAKGVCAVVYNISVYYLYCPEKSSTSVTLHRTPAPSSGSKEVQGKCSKHSSDKKDSIVAYCNSNGTWNNFNPQDNHCHCSAGREFNNRTGECTLCKKNYFGKTDACVPCPENMVSPEGAVKCKCNDTFYQISENGLCQRLPSKPEHLNFARLEDKVELSWGMPINSVGHKDVYYKVECQLCHKSFMPCEDTSIGKNGTNLTKTNLTVSHLHSNVCYKFSVTTLNDVSTEDNKNYWNSASIQVEISENPNSPTEVKTTLSTTAEVPVTTSKPKSSVTPQRIPVGGSEPSSNGAGPITLLTGVAIGIPVLVLILLIAGIVIYRSKRTRKRDINEGIPLVPYEKSYIDPTKFGDSEKAVRKFAKEIDRRQVKLEGEIGEGEFAKVHKGLLCRPNEPSIYVAVKVLKPGSSPKNREDFLTEAAVMGQFKDMNIVALEGVVTISHPVMIITEFMHNGALSKYLAENKNRLAEDQLLDMARGIASGMKYLARMRFVHRDLAARNVLVNENLVCKVADFGLTRVLEESCQGEYVTQGGKIPIRWTAPESYKHRRFTTASDVWSYGIVLWEIMSYAERPYGTWDNYMVMDQVNDNYRLTAPTNCPKIVHQLMMECWKSDRSQRPAFTDIVEHLERWLRNPYLLKDYEYVTEKTRMADRKSCIARSLREHLEGIKMERYIEKFIDYGYTELYQVQQLTDGDLLCVGVPLVGHRNKILKSLSMRGARERSQPTNV